MIQITGTAATKGDNQIGKCLLLALPPELRIRIYEYVVQRNDPPRHSHFPHNDDSCDIVLRPRCHGITMQQFPGLLSTCQRIRNESLQTYFKVNTFECLVSFATHGRLDVPVAIAPFTEYVKDIRIINIDLCQDGCQYHLDLSRGLSKNAIAKVAVTRDLHHPGTRCYLNDTELYECKCLLDDFITAAREAGDVPTMDEIKLRELIDLVQPKDYLQ